MQSALTQCFLSSGEELEKVTEAYWIAENHWAKLKAVMLPFTTEQDEIKFFKKVKPAFTCYMEYYSLLSEALVYAGKLEPAAIPRFWQQETERFHHYYGRNSDFISYIEKDTTYLDTDYFLRRTSKDTNGLFGSEPGFTAAQDYKVRTYMARLKYFNYCTEKLAPGKDII